MRSLILTVSDLDRSLALFRALDFIVVEERYLSGAAFEAWVGLPAAELRLARLRLGAEQIELAEFIRPRGRPIDAGARSNDAIFQHMAIVVRDMDVAFERLRHMPDVELVSPEPQTIPLSNPAAGGIRALYFKDFDGHALELIWFPSGKGRERWHARRAGVFLGIDHSAIAIASTELSRSFYEALGFEVAGRSLNFGVEQEALSGVAAATVQITGLAPETGPAVEFLSYLEPGPGRPAPSDSRVNDLWHWEIAIQVSNLEAARDAIEQSGGKAQPAADVSTLELGYGSAALVQDRDGHSSRLIER